MPREPISAADRTTLLVVAALCGVKVLLHLALAGRYGYHGDELYFVECGRHLALGYVDHAPMIPWIARAVDVLGGGGLVALRLPAIAAGAGTMILTALLVREWGGGLRAQSLALLSILFAPAYLRMSAMLNIPAIEVFLAAATAYLVARALTRGERWVWLLAGAVAGMGLLTKHTMLLWGCGLAVGLVGSGHGRALLTAAPWIGLTIAGLLFAPNVVWQMQHGFPTLEFAASLRRQALEEQGRALFVVAQFLYFHPFVVAVWVAGLVFAFKKSGRVARPFAILFLVMFVAFFMVGGKPYYLASAYPPVLAAGGIALERWLKDRPFILRSLVSAIAAVGLALAVLSLPLLPIRTVDAAIGRLFGWLVPPMALTHDMHGELGWDVHVRVVERVLQSLSSEDRAAASILTGKYSQAGALNVLRERPSPRAFTGHMSYHLWGPEKGQGSVVVAYGLPDELLRRHFRVVEERARIVAPLARAGETDLPVYVCRRPYRSLVEIWPELRRFHHRGFTRSP